MRQNNLIKIHLGCGHEILPGYTNLDSVSLPGVNVIHDLNVFPWPFHDHTASDILTKHVLEHLPNTIQVMEEIWRICSHGANVVIRVPYWNSRDFITDPTHIRSFNEDTFNFFDPTQPQCQERPYYSKARFQIKRKTFFIRFFKRYFSIQQGSLGSLLLFMAQYLCNVIQVMEIELSAIKERS